MRRAVIGTCLLWSLLYAAEGQQEKPADPPAAVQEPPEEDVSTEPKVEYTFNPLQAVKEMKVGNFYLKKGSHKAAARRFEEALKWDPNSEEAYIKLGEARQKMGDEKAARQAWSKYLELHPDGKEAPALRKKLGR